MGDGNFEELDFSDIDAGPSGGAEAQRQRELLEKSLLTKVELNELRQRMLDTGMWTQEYGLSEAVADKDIDEIIQEYELIPKSIIGSVDATVFKQDAYFDDMGGFARLYDTANLMDRYSTYFTDATLARYEELKPVIAEISTMTTPEALAEKYQKEGKMQLLTGVNGAYNFLLAASRGLDVCSLDYLEKLKADEKLQDSKIVDLQIGAKQGAEYRFGHVEVDYPEQIVHLNYLINLYPDILGNLQADNFAEKYMNLLGEEDLSDIYNGLTEFRNLTPQFQEMYFWLNKRYLEYAEAKHEDYKLQFYHIHMVTKHLKLISREPYRSDEKIIRDLENSAKWLKEHGYKLPPGEEIDPKVTLPEGLTELQSLYG